MVSSPAVSGFSQVAVEKPRVGPRPAFVVSFAATLFALGLAFPRLPVHPLIASIAVHAATGPVPWLRDLSAGYAQPEAFLLLALVGWWALLGLGLWWSRRAAVPLVAGVAGLDLGTYFRSDGIGSALWLAWTSLTGLLAPHPALGFALFGVLISISLARAIRHRNLFRGLAAATAVGVLVIWPNLGMFAAIAMMVTLCVYDAGWRGLWLVAGTSAERIARSTRIAGSHLGESWREARDPEYQDAPVPPFAGRTAGVLTRCSAAWIAWVIARGSAAWLRQVFAFGIIGTALLGLPPSPRTEVLLFGAGILLSLLAFAARRRFAASLAFYFFVAALLALPAPEPLLFFALVKGAGLVIGSLLVQIEIYDAVGFADHGRSARRPEPGRQAADASQAA